MLLSSLPVIVQQAKEAIVNEHTASANQKVEKTVLIHRTPADVFQFYRDFRNLSRFLGDVTDIQILDPTTSRWTIEGPLGIYVHWDTKITASVPNTLISYELAGSEPSKATWEVHFEPNGDPNTTTVREILMAPMGRLELAAMALIGKYPAQEVQANLQRLKELLETGKVTTTDYAVDGKFTPKQ